MVTKYKNVDLLLVELRAERGLFQHSSAATVPHLSTKIPFGEVFFYDYDDQKVSSANHSSNAAVPLAV